MKGLLLIGGDGPDRDVLRPFIEGISYTIAADSGFDLGITLGIMPDLVVGDMDSIRNYEKLKEIPADNIMRSTHDKDETDTEIGLRIFQEMGYERIIIAGGGGGRLDHLLGIVFLFERSYAPQRWLTSSEHIELICGEAEFSGWRGQTVSFFPIGAFTQLRYSEGLKWPLDGLKLIRGFAGISNIITDDRLKVSVGEGKLLMVRDVRSTHG